ncbi:uncharacterized protein I303_101808 [Kwoniella dejecticola CBS 10117]|uniref:ferric-chelate reductase (NADPH) n=1 Tax=Kwoniella dejecticola CBS 10117 TaxID=1296121 RepID=A0A1A6ACS2_9TREE|nr:uncharacterized protein I303_02057 [Kwoniella dejecticola CBS 10117]OBR87843.1 hypothetical protein I303_02057 [Kwoniella dejecticola CBS 10117]
MIEPRHIQDYSSAASLEPHWGYADRVVPCTNDAGSCEYLDVVYHSHDLGMLYSGIMWSVIIGGLLGWGIVHRSSSSSSNRLTRTISSAIRRKLLPEFKAGRYFFGRTTRLQVLVLLCLTVYLTIFSFVGIRYKTWITPVKNSPGVYNTRSSIGPLSDRLGILAYALTPLSILLGSRESILSQVTGIPYQHFNFLHRWLGHIIFIQSALHTIFWCIVEIRLYQPQPSVAKAWIVQPYIIWGVVAMILLLVLWGLSTSWARNAFGYEFFRKAHYVLAMVYIGACWAHWKQLECFMLPSLLLWFLDRGIRFIRTFLIHYNVLPNGKGLFETIQAKITHHDTDIVRLDFENPIQLDFEIGQHFYICFTKGGIWQSHPFTPLTLPNTPHGYLIRAKKGETKRIIDASGESTPIILTGPHGVDIMRNLQNEDNVLCVAGGTGITFVLPVLLHLSKYGLTEGRLIELVWVVRHERDTQWIAKELEELRKDENVKITIKITREIAVQKPKAGDEISKSGPSTPGGESILSKDLSTLAQLNGNADGNTEETSQPSALGLGKEEYGECPCKPPVYTSNPSGSGSSSSSLSGIGIGTGTKEIVDAEKAIEQGLEPHHRPNLRQTVRDFVSKTVNGPTVVYVSGPGGMISDVRDEVAECNDASKVWRGEERGEVRLIYDDRLE